MKAVSSLLLRLPGCSSLFAAVVALIGLVLALPASVPAASFTFTPIDAPGAFSTEAFGINATGQLVGAFADNMGTHGFLNTAGVFTPIDVPGASSTFAVGINTTGQTVGFFFTTPFRVPGFLDSGGVFTTIDVPGASVQSGADGINATGDIVGVFSNATGFHGYLDTGGVFTPIDAPGASLTAAFGINAAGQIVGRFDDATGTHGFLDTGGVFTPIDVPGASFTEAFGINAAGQIVGFFDNATGTHGFLDTGGAFTPIDVPGASRTEAFGINDKGQIVGFFDDATGEHGFLATHTAVPVPSTLLLLGTGLAFGAAWKRLRRRSGLNRNRSASGVSSVAAAPGGGQCLSLALYVKVTGRRRRSFVLPILQTLSTIICFRPVCFRSLRRRDSTALEIQLERRFLSRAKDEEEDLSGGGLERDFESRRRWSKAASRGCD